MNKGTLTKVGMILLGIFIIFILSSSYIAGSPGWESNNTCEKTESACQSWINSHSPTCDNSIISPNDAACGGDVYCKCSWYESNGDNGGKNTCKKDGGVGCYASAGGCENYCNPKGKKAKFEGGHGCSITSKCCFCYGKKENGNDKDKKCWDRGGKCYTSKSGCENYCDYKGYKSSEWKKEYECAIGKCCFCKDKKGNNKRECDLDCPSKGNIRKDSCKKSENSKGSCTDNDGEKWYCCVPEKKDCCPKGKKCRLFCVGSVCFGGCSGGPRPPRPPRPTTTTSSTTSSSTSTTTTTLPTFATSCDKCRAGESCSCEITKGKCSKGLWILRGSALKFPVVYNIPPEKVTYTPDNKGKVKALAVCFAPAPIKTATAEVNAKEKALKCDEECKVGENCQCQISDCNSGLFILRDKEGTPLNKTIIKDIVNCENCTKNFTASNTGKVWATKICLDPLSVSSEEIGITPSPTTTTSSSTTTTISDTGGPEWSAITTSPQTNTEYSEDKIYQFNITWTDPDDNIENVIIEFDGEKYTLKNDQVNRSGDEYYKLFTGLSGGEHHYRWKAVDSAWNMKQTPLLKYNVSKAPSEINLTLNGNRGNIEVGVNDKVTFKVEELKTEEEMMYLYRNFTGELKEETHEKEPLVREIQGDVVGAGTYKILGNWTGNENYTSDSESWSLKITS